MQQIWIIDIPQFEANKTRNSWLLNSRHGLRNFWASGHRRTVLSVSRVYQPLLLGINSRDCLLQEIPKESFVIRDLCQSSTKFTCFYFILHINMTSNQPSLQPQIDNLKDRIKSLDDPVAKLYEWFNGLDESHPKHPWTPKMRRIRRTFKEDEDNGKAAWRRFLDSIHDEDYELDILAIEWGECLVTYVVVILFSNTRRLTDLCIFRAAKARAKFMKTYQNAYEYGAIEGHIDDAVWCTEKANTAATKAEEKFNSMIIRFSYNGFS